MIFSPIVSVGGHGDSDDKEDGKRNAWLHAPFGPLEIKARGTRRSSFIHSESPPKKGPF